MRGPFRAEGWATRCDCSEEMLLHWIACQYQIGFGRAFEREDYGAVCFCTMEFNVEILKLSMDMILLGLELDQQIVLGPQLLNHPN